MASDSECALLEENRGAVFAVLDDQGLRPHGQNLLRGAEQIAFAGHHLGFAIVDHEDAHALQGFAELGEGAGDPKIHGIATDQLCVGQLAAHGRLQRGVDVA